MVLLPQFTLCDITYVDRLDFSAGQQYSKSSESLFETYFRNTDKIKNSTQSC